MKPKVNNKIIEQRERFCSLIYSTRRKNAEKVIMELDRLGFFKAPASRRDHLPVAGGLVEHSLNVYHMATMLSHSVTELKNDIHIDGDSLIIASLLHDICKATRYKLNTKNRYDKDHTCFPVGHGEKSVIMLLQWGFELQESEILAIRYHMGPWQIALHNIEAQEDYKQACHKCPLLTIIHTADTLASQIMENE